MDIRSYLNNLVGQRVLVNVAACEEAKGKILAVDPTTDLPAETIPDAIRVAIDRSQFTVRFDNGDLLDGRNTRIIPGRHLSFSELRVYAPHAGQGG